MLKRHAVAQSRRASARTRRIGSPAVSIAVLDLLAAYTTLAPAGGSAGPDRGETVAGTVIRVIDGDTFRLAGLEASIRVWGLDAPETGSPGGAAATAAMAQLVAGQTVTCRKRDVDHYGRLVGQCFLPEWANAAEGLQLSSESSALNRPNSASEASSLEPLAESHSFWPRSQSPGSTP